MKKLLIRKLRSEPANKFAVPRNRDFSLRFLVVSIIVLSIVFSVPAYAKSATDISVVSNGARSVALGRSGVAFADKENNAFVNPASIAAVEKLEFTSMSTQVMGMVDYKYAGFAHKLGKGALAVSYVGATSPAGYLATDENSLTSAIANPITYGSSVLSVGYGIAANDIVKIKNMGNLMLGANLKYYSQGFSGSTSAAANGYALDLGAIIKPDESLSLGLNLSNMLAGKMKWDTATEEEMPTQVKAGLTKKLMDGKLMLATDVYTGQTTTWHGGVEWLPISLLALRAGVDQDSAATNLTAGVGINLKDFSIDLAYRKDGNVDSNSNYFVSLSYSPFEVKKVDAAPVEKAKPGAPAGDYPNMIKSKDNSSGDYMSMMKAKNEANTLVAEKVDTTIQQSMTQPHETKKEASTASTSEYYKSLGIYNK